MKEGSTLEEEEEEAEEEGGAGGLSGTPLGPGVLDQPLERDVCGQRSGVVVVNHVIWVPLLRL